MAAVIKNKIPFILSRRGINITEFHNLLIMGGDDTRMSYPVAHELATAEEIRDRMEIGIIKRVARAFDATFDDLIEIEVID